MENLAYIIGGIAVLLTLYFIFKPKKEELEETLVEETIVEPAPSVFVPKEATIRGRGGKSYKAVLKPGRVGNSSTDWRYYDDGGIEILDIVLFLLIWEAFLGEEGEYTVEDEMYYEELNTTEIVEEAPDSEITTEMQSTMDETEPVIEEERTYTPDPVVEDNSSYSSGSSYESSSSSDYGSSSSSDYSSDSGGGYDD